MSDLIPLVVGGGGLAGLGFAVYLLAKIGVEKTDVKITTAAKVMIGQDRFIEQLEATVAADHKRVTELTADVDALRRELRAVTDERDRLAKENDELRTRVVHLEQRVEDLSRESRGERREREDAEPGAGVTPDDEESRSQRRVPPWTTRP